MSAGPGRADPRVNRDLNLLAPRFAAAVRDALARCRALGLDAVVFEGLRSQELQALYYARGRTRIPPSRPVTNAPSSLFSWHGYGLAVDVIHRTQQWRPDRGAAWFRDVAAVFKQRDCNWGGDWHAPDTPHFQWHRCMPSPSQRVRQIMLSEGREAVWRALDAL